MCPGGRCLHYLPPHPHREISLKLPLLDHLFTLLVALNLGLVDPDLVANFDVPRVRLRLQRPDGAAVELGVLVRAVAAQN